MWEQLTGMFDCSNMHALSKLSYLHKPLRFSDCSILLCSTFECDRVCMSIIISFVCSNDVSGDVVFSLEGSVYLNMC